MTISTLPAAPARSDPPAVFVPRAEAFVAALGTMVTEINDTTTAINASVGAVTAGTAIQLALTFRSSTTDSDPGADGNGSYRLNHATPSSATFAYIDDKNSSAADILGLLAAMGASTSTTKGQIRFYKNGSNYQVFRVTSVTNATTYYKLGLTHVNTTGTIAAGDAVTVYFTSTGDAGSFSGDINNTTVTNAKLFTYYAVNNLASTSGSINIDWSAGALYKQVEPTGTITYTMTSPGAQACHLQLHILSDGSSTAQTFNWPATVKWLGVQWTPVTNKNAIVSFYWDGTNYWAQGINEV